MIAGSHRKLTSTLLAVLTAALLWVAAAIPAAALTVTFVRHAQSEANAAGVIDTSVPGPDITTDIGIPQATAVAAALAASGIDYDAIYTSNMVRTSQTAAPFATDTGLDPIALPGFREISAGIFEGSSENSGLGRLGYGLSPVLWTLGARSVPIIGAGDGNAFDAEVDAALEVVATSGAEKPVVFSHGATIMFWTMMNVDNPDLGLMLSRPLDNTDVVVVEGSAEDGWTLKSWAGQPVGPASLGTKLLVNVRDLVVTPQTAVYNVVQAFRSGDIGKIADALLDGIGDVLRAPITFTVATVRDVVESLSPPRSPDAESASSAATTTATATLARSAAPEPAASTAAEPQDQAEAEPVRTTRTPKKFNGADRLRSVGGEPAHATIDAVSEVAEELEGVRDSGDDDETDAPEHRDETDDTRDHAPASDASSGTDDREHAKRSAA